MFGRVRGGGYCFNSNTQNKALYRLVDQNAAVISWMESMLTWLALTFALSAIACLKPSCTVMLLNSSIVSPPRTTPGDSSFVDNTTLPTTGGEEEGQSDAAETKKGMQKFDGLAGLVIAYSVHVVLNVTNPQVISTPLRLRSSARQYEWRLRDP